MKRKAMKLGIPFGVILFLLFLSAVKALAAPHEITPWQGNHKGAISITFDDGSTSQYKFAFPALEQRGMKGTFFIATGWATWPWWNEVARAGHEIGAHTVTHPHLTDIPIPEAESQMAISQAAINANITSQRCLTLAYPYGAVGSAVENVARKYFIAARIVNGDPNDPTTNYYRENAFDVAFYSMDQMLAVTNQTAAEGKWIIPLFHSFDPAEYPYGVWTSTMFLNYLDYVKAERSDLWNAPFGTVMKYLRERATATLTVASQTDKSIELKLSDTLDNYIFNQPLTIRSEVPANWTKVTMQQGATSIELTPIADQGGWVVFYDAVPDQGMITLSQASAGLSPVATEDTYAAGQGHDFKVAAPGVLQNDSGIDKAALKAMVVRGPAYGELHLDTTGAFVYKPQASFFGTDTFSYLANYGAYDSNVAVVTMNVLPGYLKEVVVQPKDVVAGRAVQGKVKLEHVVQSEAIVSLTTTSPATVPATVTVPAGSNEATFAVTATDVAKTTEVLVKASYGGKTKSFKINVRPRQ